MESTLEPRFVAEIPPDSYAAAHDQYVQANGSPLLWNTYLKIALGLSLLSTPMALGFAYKVQNDARQVRPAIIRIDELGRAERFSYEEATSINPGERAFRFFLTEFAEKHFSRVRATLQKDFPDSLLFLHPRFIDSVMTSVQQNQVLETFMGSKGGEEIEASATNVVLLSMAAPYKASVDLIKKHYATGTRVLTRQETCSVTVDFLLNPNVPDAFDRVNPLGFQVTNYRVNCGFK